MKYERVEIKTVDDLPKEGYSYDCIFTNNSFGRVMYDNQYASSSDIWWINHVKFYLRPIDEEEWLREEMIKFANYIADTPSVNNMGSAEEVIDNYLKTRKDEKQKR